MPSRPTQTILSIILGLAVGLFLGEDVRIFEVFAMAFVGLLQMAALPFVVCSVIYTIGSIGSTDLLRFSKVAVPILVLLWLLGLIAVGLFSAALPSVSFGSFFSASLVQSPPPFDWVRLFVPTNVFNALTENLVPAVVVFSVLFGIALASVQDNAALLDQFRAARDALIKLNSYVARIVPAGTFFVMGFAAGTVPFDNVALLQAYILYNAVGAFLIAVVVLPALISAMTPHSYWSVVSASREALLTAFVVGSTFVVIPMISDAVRKLDAQLGERGDEATPDPGFLVSLAYPLPDVGKVFAMFYVPFAAWFYGQELTLSEWAAFYFAIVPVVFASTTTAIPILLDVMRVPADALQLFLSTGVVAGRFSYLTHTMHLIAFAVFANCLLRKRFNLHPGRLTMVLTGLVVGMTGLHYGLSAYVTRLAEAAPSRAPLLMDRPLLNDKVPFQIRREIGESVPDDSAQFSSKLARVMSRGVLRVGYDPDELPFTYFNSNGDLVGFDVEMAHRLAADLGVRIEFVPFEHASLIEQIRSGDIDVAMAGLEGTLQRAVANRLADSYLDVTMALVVPDHRRSDFSSKSSIDEIEALKVAVVENGFFDEIAASQFPDAKIIILPSERDFFVQNPPADVLVTSAEIGSAWTLLRPEFAVTAPFGDNVKVPLFYLSGQDPEFEEFLEVWLELQTKNGTIKKLYDYWILGKNPAKRRWSVREDVLDWR